MRGLRDGFYLLLQRRNQSVQIDDARLAGAAIAALQ